MLGKIRNALIEKGELNINICYLSLKGSIKCNVLIILLSFHLENNCEN